MRTRLVQGTEFTVAETTITIADHAIDTPSIRLLYDETDDVLIASTGVKNNITCSGSVITLVPFDLLNDEGQVIGQYAAFDPNHEYTLAVDYGEGGLDSIAKEVHEIAVGTDFTFVKSAIVSGSGTKYTYDGLFSYSPIRGRTVRFNRWSFDAGAGVLVRVCTMPDDTKVGGIIYGWTDELAPREVGQHGKPTDPTGETIASFEYDNLETEKMAEAKKDEVLQAIARGGGNPSKMAYEAMKRKSEYLYEIEYSELDYEAARAYLATHFVPVGGACTALRKGNQLGRNYDWTYDKQVEFLVRTKAHNGRYASIGIAGSISALTTDTIGEYSEEFKWMPFRMLDGMNEKGLTANVNMLNHDEQRSLPVEGTVPMIEERESICSAMLVRYILDNFTTPQEACEYIRDYVRVYPPYHDGKTTDLHFSLTNKEQLYYLCFEPDNGGVFRTAIADVKDQPLPFVMTNFRMWWAQRIYDSETGKYDRFADLNYQYVEKYGMGIERANLCLDFVRDTETEQSVLSFMCNDLAYTWAYELDDTHAWLTEFVGEYSQEDLARDSAAEDFARILGIVRQRYAERSRETSLTWQTVHSVVYDLDNLTMQLVVQEGNTDDALTIDCFNSLPASKGDLGNIDFSDVAKQGNNPNVSLSSMDSKLGNMVVASQSEVTESLEYINSQLV